VPIVTVCNSDLNQDLQILEYVIENYKISPTLPIFHHPDKKFL